MPGSARLPRIDPAAPAAAGVRTATVWKCALIFLVTLTAYFPALNGGFIWDDAGHVTRPDLQSLHGLERIWFEVGATQQYYPLLHTAFWVEHRLWGDAPFGYHLLNVLLHATAACLLAVTLRRLIDLDRSRGPSAGRRPSASAPQASAGLGGCNPDSVGEDRARRVYPGVEWLAALLFALHPVCVESVAWIAEQKNTLSAVIYFCAALAYLRFDERRRTLPYVLATGLFLAALLTKTVTATLPAALLVVFWWRRGRLTWRREAVPLLPWFVLGGGAGWLTAWFEQTRIGAQGASFSLSWAERALLAGRVVWFYLGKLVWPADLIFIYPRWKLGAAPPWAWVYPLGVLAALGTLWWQRRRRAAAAGLAGGLFFVGTLFPALGFINVFPFIYSYVADHFQYLASLGIFTLAAAAVSALAASLPPWPRRLLPGFLLLGLGGLTFREAGVYHDAATLYRTTIARNPGCWMAYNNLATELTTAGRPAEAIPLLERALQLRPDFALAENNLGDDLRQMGRYREAIPHLERAVHLEPRFAAAHSSLGAALMDARRTAEGIAEFREALRVQPQYPEAHFNLGLALAKTGNPDAAVTEFAAAVRQNPGYAEAELNWAIGLTVTGRFPEAVAHFERALQLDPNSAPAHNTYGRALAEAKRMDAAIAQFEEALRLAPDFADAHLNLALALRRVGRLQEADAEYREARRLPAAGTGP